MNNNQELIDGLQAFAYFLEKTPELRQVYSPGPFNLPALTREELSELAKLCGSVDKSFTDSHFNLTKKFGPLKLDVYIARDKVCERVVTKVEVPEVRLAATEAYTIKAHTKEIVEWKCPDDLSLLKPDAEVEA